MNEINNSNVRSLAELRRERIRLRHEINMREELFAEHYHRIMDIFKPVNGVINLFKKHKDKDDDGEHKKSKSIAGTILKVAVPLIAGRQVMKHKKQFIFKPLLGYLLKKGVSYITSDHRGKKDIETT